MLRVLASICDGQNVDLQNYMREQPDNIKSVNLVAEVSKFLEMIYSSINPKTIPLLIQIFSTLNEMAAVSSEVACDFFEISNSPFLLLHAGQQGEPSNHL